MTLFQTGRFKGDSAIIDSKAFKRDLFGELDDVMEFVRKHLMSGIVITGKPRHDVKHDPWRVVGWFDGGRFVGRPICN